MKVRIDRKGYFTAASFIPNMAQCGRKETAPTYHYHVVIEADSSDLDDRGFIIDNNAISAYFVHAYERRPNSIEAYSCELVAVKACEAFTMLVKHASKVSVTIFNSDTHNVGLTAEWEAPEFKVDFYPDEEGTFGELESDEEAEIAAIENDEPLSLEEMASLWRPREGD